MNPILFKSILLFLLMSLVAVFGCRQVKTDSVPESPEIEISSTKISTPEREKAANQPPQVKQAPSRGMRTFSAPAVRSSSALNQPNFKNLIGATIVAQDNHFLGNLQFDEFDPNSLFNEFSVYRSETNKKSLFNEFGKYGDEFSDLSAFNPDADKPPKIINPEGKFIAYLTKNADVSPRVDPQGLSDWLKSFDIANRKQPLEMINRVGPGFE